MLAEETKTDFDPFAAASNPATPTFDLFGLVEIQAYACALVTGQGKVPYDPDIHEKRFTAINVYIQPLPEIEVKYPKQCECDWIAEFPTWAKITLPSIKAAGVENIREINGKWARVARVDSLEKPYPKKDAQGNPTGEKGIKKTFKFVEFFDTEEACRAAYLAAGGVPSNATGNGHNVPTAIPAEDPEKVTAYGFLKVIVPNAARGKASVEEAKAAVAQALTQYAPVAKHFTVDSAETLELINATLKV